MLALNRGGATPAGTGRQAEQWQGMPPWSYPWGFNMMNPFSWCPQLPPSVNPNDASSVVTPVRGEEVPPVVHTPPVSRDATRSVASRHARRPVAAAVDVDDGRNHRSPARGPGPRAAPPRAEVERHSPPRREPDHGDREEDSSDSGSEVSSDEDGTEDLEALLMEGLAEDDWTNPMGGEEEDKDDKVFTSDRVAPILTAAAMLAGAEYVDSKVRQSSLAFGNPGLKKSAVDPVVVIPSDIHQFQEDAASTKRKLGSADALNRVFRVSEQDFAQFFTVPQMDSDVAGFLENAAIGSPNAYCKTWESMLMGVDREIRSVTRLCTFQLLISNALSINLSDNCAEKDGVRTDDGPFAMAKLSADLNARSINLLMQLSAKNRAARRENVCTGIKNMRINTRARTKIVKKLKKLPLTGVTLFGKRKFTSTVKKVTKSVKDERTLGFNLQSFFQSSRRKRGSSQFRGGGRTFAVPSLRECRRQQ